MLRKIGNPYFLLSKVLACFPRSGYLHYRNQLAFHLHSSIARTPSPQRGCLTHPFFEPCYLFGPPASYLFNIIPTYYNLTSLFAEILTEMD